MNERADRPGPLMRRGPRPLLLHLTFAMLRSNVSRATSPFWNTDWRNSRGAAILESIQRAAQGQSAAQGQNAAQGGKSPSDFPSAVVAETMRQDAALIEGIAAYRRHPAYRTLEDPPCIWSEGSTRLLDYGSPAGRPVVFVPSLVNRAYVLDLAEGNSMLRWLALRGIRPLLLDWGWPEETERRFNLTDYVAGRMERALT